MVRIFHVKDDLPGERLILRVNVHTADIGILVRRNRMGNVAEQTRPIVAGDRNARNKVSTIRRGPRHFYDTLTQRHPQRDDILTVLAVDFDPFTDGHKPYNVIAGDRVAAFRILMHESIARPEDGNSLGDIPRGIDELFEERFRRFDNALGNITRRPALKIDKMSEHSIDI